MPRNVFSKSYLLRIFVSAMLSTTGVMAVTLPGTTALANTNSTSSSGQTSSTSPTAQTLATLVSVDAPSNGTTVSQIVNVTGWALDGVGVKDVKVLVDGKYVGTAQYGLSRPDVESVYPQYNNPNAGYTYPLDTRTLTNGFHQLGIRVDRTDGTSETFTEGTVNVQNLPTIGHMDTPGANAKVTGSSVSVSGWVLDETGVKTIDVLVNGKIVGQATYGDPRPDVETAYPKYNNGDAGYHYTLSTSGMTPGTYNLSLQVIRTDGTFTTLPGSSFDIPALPTLVSMDTPTNGASVQGDLTVRGWALDGYGVKDVKILVDGKVAGIATYGLSRPDVEAAYPQYNNANAGYSYTLNSRNFANGTHQLGIQVDRVNGTSETFTEGTVNVQNLPTIGHMDTPGANAKVTGSSVSVSGWVLDETGVKTIDVLVNGKIVGQATYGDPRPDVETAYPKYNNGDAGYHYTLSTSGMTPGTYNLSLQVIRTDGTFTTLPGSSFDIPALPTLVSMDTPTNGASVQGDLTVRGWALDGYGVKDVKILVDGTVAGTATYGLSRPDVEAAYPQYNNANAGYSYTLDTRNLANGPHQLSIQIDRVNGTSQSFQEASIVNQNLPTIGHMDTPAPNAQVTGTSMKVSGWVLDETGVKTVNVMVNGKVVGQATYGDSRPDVKAAYPQYNNADAGYHYTLDTSSFTPGKSYSIALQVIRTDGTSTVVPGTTVVMPGTLASLDTSLNSAGVHGIVNLTGWALDDVGVKSVTVLIDGKAVGTADYRLSRPDVEAAWPQFGNANSGYNYPLDTRSIPNGTHHIAIQVDGSNGTSEIFPEGNINIQNLATIGHMDSPAPNAQDPSDSLDISGWLLDQTGIKSLNVLVNGKVMGQAVYGDPRADVEAAYPQYNNANAGYHYTLDTSGLAIGSSYQLSIQVLRTDGTTATIPGSTFTVPAAVSSLDTPSNGAKIQGKVNVVGWALDSPGVNDVKILVDGKAVGTAQYGLSRPDVESAYPRYNNANSGFSYSLDTTALSNGNHQLSIQIDTANGTLTFDEGTVDVVNPVYAVYATPTQKIGQYPTESQADAVASGSDYIVNLTTNKMVKMPSNYYYLNSGYWVSKTNGWQGFEVPPFAKSGDNYIVVNASGNSPYETKYYLLDDSSGNYLGTSQYWIWENSFRTVNLTLPTTATASQIDNWLSNYHSTSALYGLGSSFVGAEKFYGSNAIYLLSHAGIESAFGDSSIALNKNNLFGFGAYDSNPANDAGNFPTDNYAIYYQSWFVRNYYLTPNVGLYYQSPTLDGMNENYATSPNWASAVATVMNDFTHDTGTSYSSTSTPVAPSSTSEPVYMTNGFEGKFNSYEPKFPGLLQPSNYYNSNVVLVQQALNANGANISVDGYFGPNTQGAVENFQKKMGLSVSGDVDQATWDAMYPTYTGAFPVDKIMVSRLNGKVINIYHISQTPTGQPTDLWVYAPYVDFTNVQRIEPASGPKGKQAQISVYSAPGTPLKGGSGTVYVHAGDYVVVDSSSGVPSGYTKISFTNIEDGVAQKYTGLVETSTIQFISYTAQQY